MDIYVPNKDLTEVTFKDTVSTAGVLAEEMVSINLRNAEPNVLEDEEIDIVEDFIGKELEEFYEECANLEEFIKKEKIQKAITTFLFNTWKDKTDATETEIVGNK